MRQLAPRKVHVKEVSALGVGFILPQANRRCASLPRWFATNPNAPGSPLFTCRILPVERSLWLLKRMSEMRDCVNRCWRQAKREDLPAKRCGESRSADFELKTGRGPLPWQGSLRTSNSYAEREQRVAGPRLVALQLQKAALSGPV